jgi:hypothetical protein
VKHICHCPKHLDVLRMVVLVVDGLGTVDTYKSHLLLDLSLPHHIPRSFPKSKTTRWNVERLD